jgi:methyltransferase family protein
VSTAVDGGGAVKTVTRWAKMAIFRSIGRSDYGRWSDAGNLEAWWETRTQKLAAMVPRGTRVIEFGAGTRPLERCLDGSCTYVASDLVDRGPDTFVCDLNRRPLPDLGHLHPDVAVFAGVLEYVRDVPSVVAWLAGHLNACAVSYAVARHSGLVRAFATDVRRTYYGYMNAYSESDLMAVFRRHGFVCVRTDSWNDQRLFLFEKPAEIRS